MPKENDCEKGVTIKQMISNESKLGLKSTKGAMNAKGT